MVEAGSLIGRKLADAHWTHSGAQLQVAMTRHAEMVSIDGENDATCPRPEPNQMLHRNSVARDGPAMTSKSGAMQGGRC